MRLGSALLLCLLLTAGTASADEKGPAAKQRSRTQPEEAADAVLEALEASDGAKLEMLARRDRTDPWVVADELCRRGAYDAAEAFAKAAPSKAVENLPGYVASMRGKAPDRSVRKALAVYAAAKRRGDAAAALAALDGVEPAKDSVLAVIVASRRGEAHGALRQFEEGAAAYRVAAAAATRVGWYQAAALSLFQAGAGAYRRLDWRTALSAWQGALDLFRVLGQAKRAAQTEGNIGALHEVLGDPDEALASFERALKGKTALGDKAGATKLLTSIGKAHTALGNYDEALTFLQRALTAKRDRDDKPGVMKALRELGDVHAAFEEYEKALAMYAEALATATALGHELGVAKTLCNIGNARFCLGDFARSLTAHERALAASRAIGDHRGSAAALGNLGSVHLRLGRPAEALSFYEQALAATEALADRAGAAKARSNLGRLHCRLGEYDKALSFHEQALADRVALRDKAGEAATLGALGGVFYMRDDLDRALSILERALKLKLALRDSASAASTRVNIGNVYADLGTPQVALASYETALSEAKTVGDKAGVAVALAAISRLHCRLGDNAKAADAARAGVQYVNRLTRGLAEVEGAVARDSFAELFDLGCRAAHRAGREERLLWFLEQARASSLRESLGSRTALEAAVLSPGLTRTLRDARREEHKALTALRRAQRREVLSEVRLAHGHWEAAQAKVSSVSARIRREAKVGASLALPAPDAAADIRGRLDPGDVLLLLGLTSEEAVGLVVRRDGQRIVELPASAEIESAVGRLALSDPERDNSAAIDRLTRLLVDPLALAEDVTRVLVSPSGSLGYVPFALLFPKKEVAYVPSGTTYGLLLGERDKRGERVLAFGDPDYETTVDETALGLRRAGTWKRLPALPGTRTEVQRIADVSLLGRRATESGLQDAVGKAHRWRAVHFACHGLVDPERPMLSSLALTADAEADGFLTALEILPMEIRADLVVLSACETGKGRIFKTDGILGLTRAFMFAGAPRVICSLWKVDDEATQALMIRFYELWNGEAALSERSESNGSKEGKRIGAAEALEKAQAYIRDHPEHPEWKHPYYWAAWVLWGLPE